MTRTREQGGPSVAVIGGGLAGMAAAVAASEQGLRVEVFEARRRLGGRAGSFCDPQSGELIDHCQHVSLGCCTNLADFCRRTGIADAFQRHRRLHFFGPDGSRHDFCAAGWLPAPLHLLPGLMGLGYLTWPDRLRIARTMLRLARSDSLDAQDSRSIGQWLREQGESEQAIERFWSVVLVSALSETVEHASLAAARKVFVDGFLASPRAYEVEIPRVPLGEIYDRRLAAWLTEHGVRVHLGTRVAQIEGTPDRAAALILADGTRRSFDWFVVAVPWRQVRPLLAPPLFGAIPALEHVDQIQSAPITAVHLWFDRPITPLPHAVLVGRLSQWVFRKGGDCYQVVISASHELKGRKREEVVAQVRGELEALWPETRRANLLHWRMVTEPEAVFSVRPGLDRIRPAQQTPVPNLMLAGDWTATGWPATMEGAVRSGYLAVEALLAAFEKNQRLLIPDVPHSRLVRLLTG